MKSHIGILLLCYNRVDNLENIISQLLEFTPDDVAIYIHVDGPKKSDQDVLRSNAVINVINRFQEQNPKRIETKIQQENLGCYLGVREAINWVFMYCKNAIIIEDDLILARNYFSFIELNIELLENQNVGSLSLYCEPIEYNPVSQKCVTKFHSSWGWVTSDVKWKCFTDQLNIKEFTIVLFSIWFKYGYQLTYRFYLTYQRLKKKELDSWAYRWQLSCLYFGLLSVYPQKSLTSNVGFSDLSTHTKIKRIDISKVSDLVKIEKTFFSNEEIKVNRQFELQIIKKRYGITKTSMFPSIPDLIRRFF